jgi:hypothetical protein
MAMKMRYALGGALVLAVTMAGPLWAQEAIEIPGEMTTTTGVVEAIDHTQRVLTVRDTDGNFVAIDVPEGAERFDEVKVGDSISVRYYDTVSVRRKPDSEPDVDSASVGATPTEGGAIGGTVATQRTITATVAAIDRETRAITFTGPSNFNYSRRASESTDLSTVNVGDRIDVTWTHAVTIIINPH